MQKKELTSTYLYYGDVKMPKGFEINPKPLKKPQYPKIFLRAFFPSFLFGFPALAYFKTTPQKLLKSS